MLELEKVRERNDALSVAMAKRDDYISRLRANYDHADYDAQWKGCIAATLMEGVIEDKGRGQGLRNMYARLRAKALNDDGTLNEDALAQWKPLFAELDGGAVTMEALEADYQRVTVLEPNLVDPPAVGLGLVAERDTGTVTAAGDWVPPAPVTVHAWEPCRDMMQDTYVNDPECNLFTHAARGFYPVAPTVGEYDAETHQREVATLFERWQKQNVGHSLASWFGHYVTIGALHCYNERLKHVTPHVDVDVYHRSLDQSRGECGRDKLEEFEDSMFG